MKKERKKNYIEVLNTAQLERCVHGSCEYIYICRDGAIFITIVGLPLATVQQQFICRWCTCWKYHDMAWLLWPRCDHVSFTFSVSSGCCCCCRCCCNHTATAPTDNEKFYRKSEIRYHVYDNNKWNYVILWAPNGFNSFIVDVLLLLSLDWLIVIAGSLPAHFDVRSIGIVWLNFICLRVMIYFPSMQRACNGWITEKKNMLR